MDFIVSMMRDSSEAGGRDRFSCSLSTWELFIELGRTFGWQPLGTTYLPAQGSNRAISEVRHDYKPGDAQDYKRVESDDAISWAAALSQAKRSKYLAAMLESRPDLATPPVDATAEQAHTTAAPFIAVMDEFIEYAFGGAFSFGIGN